MRDKDSAGRAKSDMLTITNIHCNQSVSLAIQFSDPAVECLPS
jgi:hypothetical protein